MRRTILYLVFVFVLTNNACAVSIGAGPSTINFGDIPKGGYDEATITVSTSSSEDLTCKIFYDGEIGDWLNIDGGGTFELPAQSRKDLILFIQPPTTTPNGNYSGAITIKAAATSTIDSGAGLSVGAGVRIRVSATVTGDEKIEYDIISVEAESVEVTYPIPLDITIKNNGNVRITPKVDYTIFNARGETVKTGTYEQTDILPKMQ